MIKTEGCKYQLDIQTDYSHFPHDNSVKMNKIINLNVAVN